MTKETIYPKGTTKQQWDQYYSDLREWEIRMEREKPHPDDDFEDGLQYDDAMIEWDKKYWMDRPNAPDSEFANND